MMCNQQRKPFMSNQPDNTAVRASSMSLLGKDFSANPFPLFAQMRAIGPIVQIPLPFRQGQQTAWVVTRLEEAVQILKDKRFTVEASRINPGSGFFGQRADNASATPGFLGRSMIAVDEPDHMRLRGLVSKAFTPKYIQSLRPRIQQLADELLDKVQEKGSMDLVHDFAYPLPINVISEMLGVPQKNRELIREWSNVLAGGVDQGIHEERRGKIRAFSEYIVELVADKRQ